MTPPFSIEQFLGVFAAYNAAIWPVQILAYAVGIAAIAALWYWGRNGVRIILLALALMWAINGLGYHLLFFADINPVAMIFAAFFILQSALFVMALVWPGYLRFDVRRDFQTIAGFLLMFYVLLIYPVLGLWSGHGLMAGPMFGVAPCPTTIFTIGMLLLARGKWVLWLSVIPLLWSLVGLAAALQLDIREDFGLPVAGVFLVIALLTRKPDVARNSVHEI